jgi:hypothetical protein
MELVLASRKVAGRNVTIDEHDGKGTVINVDDRRGGGVIPPTGCPPAEVDEITVTFSGIVACECLGSGTESFIGTDLGGLNGTFVLPRISSSTFQLSRGPLYRVTKWSPNTDCTGDIEFEHESDVLVYASCNAETDRWTIAIQDQVDFFYAFFGRGDTMPIAAEGVCDFPTSPDLFIDGTATVSF